MALGTTYIDTVSHIDRIDPDNYAAATYNTGWWPLINTRQSIYGILMVGDMGTSATVDLTLQQATDGSGTGSKTLLTTTQMVQGTNDNELIVIEAVYADMDTANSFTHLRAQIVVGTAAVDLSFFLALWWNQVPSMSELDAAFVTQSVT